MKAMQAQITALIAAQNAHAKGEKGKGKPKGKGGGKGKPNADAKGKCKTKGGKGKGKGKDDGKPSWKPAAETVSTYVTVEQMQ